MEILIKGKSAQEIFKALDLKEHSVYKVKVKCSEHNIKHFSYLFTGFKTGAYCEVFTNSYDVPLKMKSCYSLEVVKLLDSGTDNSFAEDGSK